MRVQFFLLLMTLTVSFIFQSCEPPNNPPTIIDPNAEFIKVDGFTSATRKLRVDSVLVYRDSALVYWWEYYELDADVLQYRIEWGKDPTNFTDTLELKPYVFRTVTISTIPNLEPSTTYYAQFYRDWHGTVKKTTFNFTTPNPPAQ